jgi:uncharacterized protein (TIGR03437 family)
VDAGVLRPWTKQHPVIFFLRVCFLSAAFAVSLSAQTYTIGLFAGGGAPPLTEPASAPVGAISGLTIDAAGNIYFVSLNCLFRLDAKGTVTRIAGTGQAGYSGDGGPALAAQLPAPSQFGLGIAVDSAGDVFIPDPATHRVRMVSASGVITTVAGNGTAGSSGDGGAAAQAELKEPTHVVVDRGGNLYISDYGDNVVRKVTPTGTIGTVAGTGVNSFSGDGGAAVNAGLGNPLGLAIDASGDLYIADFANQRIRLVDTKGVIQTVAGSTALGGGGKGAVAAFPSNFLYPDDLAADAAGDLLIGGWTNTRILEMASGGVVSTIATGTSAAARGLAIDSVGNLNFGDPANNRLQRVSTSSAIFTIAGDGEGGFSGDGGAATAAQISNPQGLAIDTAGNLYIADTGNFRVRKVSLQGIITSIAGNGTQGFSGDGRPATSAQLASPVGLAVDGYGNLYIADASNVRVRKVSAGGVITTIAGTGPTTNPTFTSGTPAITAAIESPLYVAVDAAGNVYFATHTHLYQITPAGILNYLRLTTTSFGGIATDGAGNIYLSDPIDGAIDDWTAPGATPSVFPITTGCGAQQLYGGSTGAIAIDGAGDLYSAESLNIARFSKWGAITIAGNGTYGDSGDGGPALDASLEEATALAADNAGNVYFADAQANIVRVLRRAPITSSIAAVVNAASGAAGALAPGEMVLIFGSDVGEPQLLACPQGHGGYLSQSIEGAEMTFNGIPAPLVYVSGNQTAAIVPFEVTGSSLQVKASPDGQASASFTMALAPAAPGLFTANETGSGQAAAVNQDLTINSSSHPAKHGSIISLYATGVGQTTPPGVDGNSWGRLCRCRICP